MPQPEVEWAYLTHADHDQDPDSVAWLMAALAGVAGRRPIVLDVGCGAGLRLEQLLIDADMDVVGVDPSPAAVDTARSTVPDAIHAERDLFDLDSLHPVGARFDAAVSLFALATLPRTDVLRTLAAVRHVLTAGGLFLLAMPEGDSDIRDDHSTVPQTAFPADQLRQLLEHIGLQVMQIRQTHRSDGHDDLFACCVNPPATP
jgi:cyclopropane fatty-acyl-phospholipid synthase-like methyltransferase